MILSKEEPQWTNVAGRIFINTIFHPIEYAKFLIQIGHEPIAPRETVTFFCQPALSLPNVFSYLKYIKNVDGFTGCYRGLIPKLCANTVSAVAFEKAAVKFKIPENLTVDEDELSEEDRRKKYIQELIRDLISRSAAIIVSQPLEVVALRMMAQFVGGETKYNGIFGSFIEIYKEDGITGYFSGLIPKLLANAATLALVFSSTYALNKYVIRDKEIRPYTSSTVMFLATTVTYPLLVVSNCMAVNNCGLIAGVPPQMPIYNNWLDCWSHLSGNNQLKRGSSLLWRYYTGPQVTIGGKLYAIQKDAFYAK